MLESDTMILSLRAAGRSYLEIAERMDGPDWSRRIRLIQKTVRKGRAASGLRSGAHTHPERRPRGERHGWYTKPHRRPRGARNGRHTKPECSARGERVNTAKLTWDAVTQLRSDADGGDPTRILVRRYGVGPSTVRRIVSGKYWNEVYRP